MLGQVCRGGTAFRALQNCGKIKTTTTTITRSIASSTGSGTTKRFTTTLLVCGAVAGAVGAEVLLWGYKYRHATASQVTKSACDHDNQDAGGNDRVKLEKSMPVQNDNVAVVKDGCYEARLNEAIAKSRDLLHRVKDEYGAPGIVAAVSINGQCLWSEGLGYSDVENRVACTPSTVHRIASISKSFTMVAVARLIEEGKLDIDKAIQEYVPTFPEKTWKGEKVDIKTRQLLSHLGGIRHYNRDYIKANQHKSTKDDKTDKNTETKGKSLPSSDNSDKKNTNTGPVCENKNSARMSDAKKKGDERFKEFFIAGNCNSVTKALDIFKDDPLVHPPGSKFLYTTYGWTLVSAVVETAGGKPFLKQMAGIFKDLDMNHTVPDEHTPIIYNRARGYSYNKCGRLVNTPHVNLSLKWAGGGYLSTVDDLIKFGNAMLYSYQYTNKHTENNLPPGYLKPETMATMWKPVSGTKVAWDSESQYAMGWSVVDRDQMHGQCRKSRHMISHTGGAVGFSSVLLIAPSTKDDVKGNHGNREDITVDSPPPNGVVVAMITNLGATSLYKTAVKIGDIFREL